jgi:uncharacterized protein (TIGR01777 family)
MKILLTGSSGLIGSALVPVLTAAGHTVVPMVRKKPVGANEVYWNIDTREIDSASMEGADAVVHLAGDPIASEKWTPERKFLIRESRIKGTTILSEAIAKLSKKPKTFVVASAIGYYGDRQGETVNERSAPGMDWLSHICRDWERTTDVASEAGIRTVLARFGIVLSPKGGALERMLTPFKLGVGGKFGEGRHYMSWISIDDAARAVLHLIETESIRGPVNVVAPNPVSNEEFTKTLGSVLGRPAILSVPEFALRMMFGEMANHLLLTDQRVEPAVLDASGFTFRHPKLEGALRAVLGK